jgi:hypothetical protein
MIGHPTGSEVFASLGRSDQRLWGERYVRGLLGEG